MEVVQLDVEEPPYVDLPEHAYRDPVANPFATLKMQQENILYKAVKYLIGFCVLLPVRAALTLVVFLGIVIVSFVGTLGLKSVHDAPLSLIRRILLWPLHIFARMLLFVWGFYWIPTKGTPEYSGMLAPVIVCNHVSFIDGLYIFYVWNGSGISRIENGKMPVVGSLMHGTQSILIDRTSSESRKAGFNNIVKRAKSAFENPDFKQIELFPEGTTTNGTALVQFKVGAFAAGVPVQPIILKYPNKYCDLTWPPNVSVGPTVLWMAVQFVNFMEAEFLPPYNPNEQEKADPQLYADNVRNYMAKASGLPTTEHSYDDCKLMFEASKLKLPENAVTSLQMEPINKIFNLSVEDAKLLLKEFAKYDPTREGKLGRNDFARLLNLPEDSPVVHDLFFNMDKDEDGLVSFKEYILGIAFWKAKTPSGLIKEAFDIFDTGHDGLISMDDVGLLLKNLFPNMTKADTEKFFGSLDKDSKGRISLEDFVACAQNHPHYVKIAQLMQKRQAQEEEQLN